MPKFIQANVVTLLVLTISLGGCIFDKSSQSTQDEKEGITLVSGNGNKFLGSTTVGQSVALHGPETPKV
jgi:hypothetical protein